MKYNGIYYIKFYSLIVLAILIGGYSIFQSQKIIWGPRIIVSSPLHGATYTTDLIDIKGVVKNVTNLSLNDRILYPDKEGNFYDRLLLLPGYNIIKLEGNDKFGAKTEKKIEVIFKQF